MFGSFLLVTGLAQIPWSLFVLAYPTRLLLRVGISGNAAIMVTWAVSRSVGLPFGPKRSEPEPIQLPDIVSTALEVFVVAGAAMIALQAGRTFPAPRRRPAVLLASFTLALTALSLLSVAGVTLT
jgi:hypothetical protein